MVARFSGFCASPKLFRLQSLKLHALWYLTREIVWCHLKMCLKIRQPCCQNVATLLVPCIFKCHYSISCVKKQMDTNLQLRSSHSLRVILEIHKSGKTVVKIWQPCWSKIFLNATIRFLVSKNRGILIFSLVVLKFWKMRGNPQNWQH